MCPICNTKLCPIIYNTVDDIVLENMHQIGQIILVKSKAYIKAPRSYCNRCHTGFHTEVDLDNII
jgi:hypothetical protein